MLASAFVAKAVLGISTTTGLIERLVIDRALKRICGFSMWKQLPGKSAFSRAFAKFAGSGLAERTHAALVKGMLTINRGRAVQLHETGTPLKFNTLLSWLRSPL